MTAKQRLVVLGGIRTPFLRAGSDFQKTSAADLASLVFREAIARLAIDPAAVDEVILGCAGQPIEAQNVARVAALRAGIPESVPALTVHRNCASGMEAITQAMLRIRAGEADLMLVGGAEAMSRAPVLFSNQAHAWLMKLAKLRRTSAKLRHLASLRPSFLKPQNALILGLTDPVSGMIMGDTAELLARDYGITREEQDAYALRSHERAGEAWSSGRLGEEAFGVVVPPALDRMADHDDGIREGLSEAKLAKLRPYFDRQHGTVTVGNACQITDGAVALLVSSESWAARWGGQPLGYLREFAYAGLDPRRMGLGPVYATRNLLEKTGGTMDDFDLVELNEAFAAQVLACQQAFGSDNFAAQHLNRPTALGTLDEHRLNVNGGAIALGHPVGATGTRLVLTLLHELRRRQQRRGLATLCVGGGQGAALDLESAET